LDRAIQFPPYAKFPFYGDPMAPFLFMVVAEGLCGLIREAIEKDFLGVSKWVDMGWRSTCYNMQMTPFSLGKLL